jgi:ATP-binding protein involved in chromosome partitioning
MSASNAPTSAAIETIVGRLVDPEIGRSLAELKMVRSVRVGESGAIDVALELPTPAYPDRDRLARAVREAISAAHPSASPAEVAFSWKVRGTDAGGRIGLRVHNVIAVGSGKGGVGKSTMAASIAWGLKRAGAKVGLMDADIYGPSIPHLLGVSGRPEVIEELGPDGQSVRRIGAIDIDGLKVMSIGFLVGADEPVVVRGPILHRTIQQFLQETAWGELDYLIIDLPPGTGDIALTLSQLMGLSGAVVVCTPQQVALLDAVKAINMFRKVNIPVLGVIENMSGEIFGRGGAKAKAEEMGVPFLGEVPIDARLRVNGDAGHIASNFLPECPSKAALEAVCERVAIQIAKEVLTRTALPTLEIL